MGSDVLFVEWFANQASFIRSRKSAGNVLGLLDFARPGGEFVVPGI